MPLDRTSKTEPSATDGDQASAERAARDRGAFAALYRRYLPMVYRYLLARFGNVQVTEEVAAQTFEAALLGIGPSRSIRPSPPGCSPSRGTRRPTTFTASR